jgi:hypothetical protein
MKRLIVLILTIIGLAIVVLACIAVGLGERESKTLNATIVLLTSLFTFLGIVPQLIKEFRKLSPAKLRRSDELPRQAEIEQDPPVNAPEVTNLPPEEGFLSRLAYTGAPLGMIFAIMWAIVTMAGDLWNLCFNPLPTVDLNGILRLVYEPPAVIAASAFLLVVLPVPLRIVGNIFESLFTEVSVSSQPGKLTVLKKSGKDEHKLELLADGIRSVTHSDGCLSINYGGVLIPIVMDLQYSGTMRKRLISAVEKTGVSITNEGLVQRLIAAGRSRT